MQKIFQIMKTSFTLEIQKHPVKNVLVTTCKTSNTQNAERNSTELSKYIRELKDAHISSVKEWCIVTSGIKNTINFL